MEMAAGRKRGEMETEDEARRMKAARNLSTARLETLRDLHDWLKKRDEAMMKRALERRKKENPDGEPIVLEALTEQDRAALVQEDREWERRRLNAYLKNMERVPDEIDPDEDNSKLSYLNYRQHWNFMFSKKFGYFDDTTPIPSMCYTDRPMLSYTRLQPTLQIFSAKVVEIGGGLHWPLDVYGFMAVRDKRDRNRNIFFDRTRDNCQTLTEQDPYLVLTGPIRAPVYGRVYIDAELKVKGTTESEDEDLIFVAANYNCCPALIPSLGGGDYTFASCVSSRRFTSKLSSLEMTCGIVVDSVEATIDVYSLDGGSWPDGMRGQFFAYTASVDHMRIVLLDSSDEKVPFSANGTVELSRRVVSVESCGQLIVCVVAWQGGHQVTMHEVSFVPEEAGRSHGVLDFGFCKMGVTVAWSLFLNHHPNVGVF